MNHSFPILYVIHFSANHWLSNKHFHFYFQFDSFFSSWHHQSIIGLFPVISFRIVHDIIIFWKYENEQHTRNCRHKKKNPKQNVINFLCEKLPILQYLIYCFFVSILIGHHCYDSVQISFWSITIKVWTLFSAFISTTSSCNTNVTSAPEISVAVWTKIYWLISY